MRPATGDALDERTLVAVMPRLRPRLRARIRSRCSADDDELDDLEQTIWCRAWDRRETFRGDGSLDAWVLRIADNVARDARRARRCAARDRRDATEYYESMEREPWASEHDPRERAPSAEWDRVCNTVAALPERRRAFFIASCMLGMPAHRIAADFGVAVKSVSEAVSRARAGIRASAPPPRGGGTPSGLGVHRDDRRDNAPPHSHRRMFAPHVDNSSPG